MKREKNFEDVNVLNTLDIALFPYQSKVEVSVLRYTANLNSE
jgi:hypothetical protein